MVYRINLLQVSSTSILNSYCVHTYNDLWNYMVREDDERTKVIRMELMRIDFIHRMNLIICQETFQARRNRIF